MADSLDAAAGGALGAGTRGTVFVVFGGEIGAMLLDNHRPHQRGVLVKKTGKAKKQE